VVDVQALERLNPESRNLMAWNAGLGAFAPTFAPVTRSRRRPPEPTNEEIAKVDAYFGFTDSA
jgi:hypothetical protein